MKTWKRVEHWVVNRRAKVREVSAGASASSVSNGCYRHNKTESGDNSIRTEWESCHGVYSAAPSSYLFTFSGAKSREQQLTICKSFKGKREASAVVAVESRDRQKRQHHKGIKWVPPRQITKPVDTQENNNRFRGCFLPPAPYLKVLFSFPTFHLECVVWHQNVSMQVKKTNKKKHS